MAAIQVAVKFFNDLAPSIRPWVELNKRRFELIDSDIQGKITPEERLELAGLTQRMREHLDSEINLPFKGAQKLHRYLTELVAEKTGLEE